MKYFYFLVLLCCATLAAQPSVKGKLGLMNAAHDRDYILRNTKVILLTKTSRDTATINERLEFEFPHANAGTGYLYLASPVLPSHTEYKFRIKKHKPTKVSIEYGRFQTQMVNAKSPDEREKDFDTALFITRLAIDLAVIIQAVTR